MVIVPKLGMITIEEIKTELMNNFKFTILYQLVWVRTLLKDHLVI